jgi:hypothetical protein
MKYLILILLFVGCNTVQPTQTETINLEIEHIQTILISESPVIQEFLFDVKKPPFENAQIRFTNDEISQFYRGSFYRGKTFNAVVEYDGVDFSLVSLRLVL